MRKLLILILAVAIPAFGQSAYYQNNAFSNAYLNGTHVVTVMDGASVEICTTVTGVCTKVPIYSDSGLTISESNPIPVDAGGNFGFWVAPGTYSYWVLDSTGNPLLQVPFTTGGASGSGAGITALTGDVTASGSGSVPATLATVNTAPGLCGDATHVCQVTTNGKGLVTGQSPVAITFSSSGVSSLNSLTGAINITAGSNISVTPSGSSIAIASTSASSLSGQTIGYLPKASSATASTGPSIISDDGTNATVHGGVVASNVTDSALSAGNCVQTAAAGLLGSTGTPCLNPVSPTVSNLTDTGTSTLNNVTIADLKGNQVWTPTGATGSFTLEGSPTSSRAVTFQDAAGTVALVSQTVPLYSTTGTAQPSAHSVLGSGTLAGGTLTVTLSGSAVFTSATSYSCSASDTTAPNAIQVTYTSGSSITFTGTTTDAIRFSCIGN